MEASNLMGGFVPCGDDDEWDINIFFCDDNNHELDLGLQTSFVGDQYPPSSFSSSSSSHDHNQVYFPANQAYNNGGGDDYCYFDQPQENFINEQVMQIDADDINDFFVPDFSENVLAAEGIHDLGFVENHEGYRHHDVVSVKKSCKRKFKSSPEMEDTVEVLDGIAAVKNPKKKPRVSRPVDQLKVKNKKNVAAEPKRRRKLQKNGDDEGKMMSMPKLEEGSDDDTVSNGSKAAPRASKAGAATIDSQSLYARKRREKINERLKILQNLVPNGTKVDISTMLEEAVIYVKFLQLQIKLLSSEDMWMYAPIAYNGMDIGRLNQILPL